MPEDETINVNAFFERENTRLLRVLRHYVLQTGLSADPDAAALELLSEVVVETLHHRDRFRSAREPRAWVLGVALNLIRRKLDQRKHLEHREPLLRDLYTDQTLPDEEIIDQFIMLSQSSEQHDADEMLSALLAHTSEDDRTLLTLAFLYELDGDKVAQQLGITPGAARVRLHRALKRLRQFWGSRKRVINHD